MIKQLSIVSVLFLFVNLLTLSCRKESARPNDNNPPVANAGNDTIIVLPSDSSSLDGTASYDPDNNITGYQWIKISGPSTFSIDNASAAKTNVASLIEGIYEFELKVTDAAGLFANDTVKVVVVSGQSACNIETRPVIQARLIPLGNLSIGRTNIVTAATNNKILFAGGYSYIMDGTGIPMRRIDIYDINSNSWSTKDLFEYPTWRADMGIAASNNKIFLAGGGFWGDDIYTNRVDIYNTSEDSWSADTLSEYVTGAAGVSAGNKVFFAGGFGFNNGYYWSNKVDIYDITTNTWTKNTLSERRGYISAVHAGNKIYFAGGQKNDGNFLPSDRIDEYDLLTNSWSTSSLQEARAGMGVISFGNKVFFAGGQTPFGPSGKVEIRDIVTGLTSISCINPRGGLSAVLKDDKIVFFTGSGGDPGDGVHFEIYNLTTDTWYTAVLDKSITHAAIISVNNVIYVAGGFVNGVGSDQVWKLEF